MPRCFHVQPTCLTLNPWFGCLLVCAWGLTTYSSKPAPDLPKPGLRADFELTEPMQECEMFSNFLIGLIDAVGVLNISEGKELFRHVSLEQNKLYFTDPHGIYGMIHRSLNDKLEVVEEIAPPLFLPFLPDSLC